MRLLTCLSYLLLAQAFSLTHRPELKQEVRQLFIHGYEGYLRHAYPADELRPISCTPLHRDPDPTNFGINDIHANVSLTLIDSLSSLPFIYPEALPQALELVSKVSFDQDVKIQVFELTIRGIGSLLSVYQHLLNQDDGGLVSYAPRLLEMARDLGERFLPAFETATGLPYARVNLRYGVEAEETVETCLAGAGTLLLEFAMLSRLTNDSRFEDAARRAYFALWNGRSLHNLLGNTIGVTHGQWLAPGLSGIQAGMDSFFEYGLKAAVLLGDDTYYDIFQDAYSAIMTHVRTPGGFVYRPVQFRTLSPAQATTIDSLSAYFAGLQVQHGDIESAIKSHLIYWHLWDRYGGTPETWDVGERFIVWGGWPGRPEFVESTYYLYRATKDPFYLRVGERILNDIRDRTMTTCGFATIKDLETGERADRMESFMLSETLKYLYLLFDDAGTSNQVFNTEGHPLSLPHALVDKPSPQRRAMHRGEDLFCPAYEPTRVGGGKSYGPGWEMYDGIVVGIEGRGDYDYARSLVFGPDAVPSDPVVWDGGVCKIGKVPQFSLEVLLRPADSQETDIPPIDLSPSLSKVHRSDTTGDYTIHDVDGIRLGVQWRLDNLGYDVSNIGPYRVRPGQSVTITDSKMSGYLPVPSPAPVIINPPSDVILRFSTTNEPNPIPDVFLSALASTATFGKALGPNQGAIFGLNTPPIPLVPLPPDNTYLCNPLRHLNLTSPFILLAERGNCTFLRKTLHAHRAGASGLLIIGSKDVEGNMLLRPSAELEPDVLLHQVRDMGVLYAQSMVGEAIHQKMDEGLVQLEVLHAEGAEQEFVQLGKGETREGRLAIGQWEIWNLRVVEPP